MLHESSDAATILTVVGAAIIDSPGVIGDWASATFDRVEYASDVTADGDACAVISLRDRFWHGEHELDHRRQKVVWANPDGRIAAIRDVNLPGDPENATAFNAKRGVSKPG